MSPTQGLPSVEDVAKDCPISAVLDKRIDDKGVEYYIEWLDDSKENSWETRLSLWSNWVCRPIIQQFEKGILDSLVEKLTTAVGDKGCVEMSDLTSKLKDIAPKFRWQECPPYNGRPVRAVHQLCRCIPELVVQGIGKGMKVGTKKYFDEQKAWQTKRLKEYFCELIDIVKELNGKSHIGPVNSAFNRRLMEMGHGHKLDCQAFGFAKFKQFTVACPGLKVEGGDPTILTLEDDEPEELKEVLEQKKLEWKRSGKHNRTLPELRNLHALSANTPKDLQTRIWGRNSEDTMKMLNDKLGIGPGANRRRDRSRSHKGQRRRYRTRSRSRERVRRRSPPRRRSRSRRRRDKKRRKKRRRSESPSSDASS